MNTVNYNDAEQLFGAVGTSLKKHTAEIADFVNVYGAKNLIPYPYYSTTITTDGVTFTDNGDGTITANGTSSATATPTVALYNNNEDLSSYMLKPNTTYKLSAELQNATDMSIFVNVNGSDIAAIRHMASGYHETTFTTPASFTTRLVVGIYTGRNVTYSNTIIKPMLRLASIEDDTYVPYAKTNQQLTQETTGLISNNFANGAVNLLPIIATTRSDSGITFTVNDDGTIVVNGTATGDIYFPVFATYNSNEYPLISGRQYCLSGCPSGGGFSSFRLYLEMNSVRIDNANDIGDGATFTAPAFNVKFAAYIRVFSGQTFNNKVFKPMLTVADMPNSDYAHYVPYAKSNKELTDDISSLAARIKAIEDTNHLTYG